MTRRPGRPAAEDTIPAEVIERVYRDLGTPLSVSAASLGLSRSSIQARARSMGLPIRVIIRRQTISASAECRCCAQVKALDDFGLDPRSPNGRSRRCRVCLSAYHKEWRSKNIEHVRERKRQWMAQHRRKAQAAMIGLDEALCEDWGRV